MSAPESRPAPEPRSPLAGHLKPGRHGAAGSRPLVLREVPATIVGLAARRGRAAELTAAVRGALALDLPPPGRGAAAAEATALWIQPDTWLVVAPRGIEGALAARLKGVAGAAGSVVDQSHGKTLLHLAGADARATLGKGCRIDLDPAAFGPGRAAVTQMAQVGCVLHQRDDVPSFSLIVPSSYAIPFFDWLCHSAAEFGYEVQ